MLAKEVVRTKTPRFVREGKNAGFHAKYWAGAGGGGALASKRCAIISQKKTKKEAEK